MFCRITANFSTQLSSTPRPMIVAFRADLPGIVVHSRPDNISSNGRRQRTIAFQSEKNEKCISPVEIDRVENRDVLSVSRNQQVLKSQTDPVAAMNYKEAELIKCQTDCHTDIETTDSETVQNWLGEQVNMCQSLNRYRQEIFKMLKEYEHMWDRHTGQIRITSHPIAQFDGCSTH